MCDLSISFPWFTFYPLLTRWPNYSLSFRLWLLPFLSSTLGLRACARLLACVRVHACAQFLNDWMCGFKHAHIGKPISMEMNWNDQSCYLNGPCNCRFCWVFMLLWQIVAFAFWPGGNLTNFFFLQAFIPLFLCFGLSLCPWLHRCPDIYRRTWASLAKLCLEYLLSFPVCALIKWRRLKLHTVKITVPAGVVTNWWLL